MPISSSVLLVSIGLVCSTTFAADIFSDAFDSAASASSYHVYVATTSAGDPKGDATFGYDYSAVGIPKAPNTPDSSTVGLRLRVSNLSEVPTPGLGSIDVATFGLDLPAAYRISVDVWANYIGGTDLSGGGTNSTFYAEMSAGSAGTGLNGNDPFRVRASSDGGKVQDYLIVTNRIGRSPTSGNYTAGTSSAALESTASYYTSLFPSTTAPAFQQTNYPTTQTGSTPAGVIGFAWHTFDIVQDGAKWTWLIDNNIIGTVPNSTAASSGEQFSLSAHDSDLTGGSSAEQQSLNAVIFDNLRVSALPEPRSAALLGLGIAGLLSARRRTSV